MAIGRLAWNTPTGAMLWEIWGRHKKNFLWHGVALAVCLFLVRCKEHGVSEIPAALLSSAALGCFLGAYLDLVACFAHVEINSGKLKAGYPDRLLLKPLRTIQLVLLPMLFGGLVTTLMFIIWMKCVVIPMGHSPTIGVWWTGAVALSFFWWSQAVAWGFPALSFRSLIMVALIILHFLVWVIPEMPTGLSSETQWLILAALLVPTMPVAWIGLILTRQGTWEGPSRISLLWSWVGWPRAWGRRACFRSAFAAQFWLEWRRQGWLLPNLVGMFTFLVFPFLFALGFKWVGVDVPPPPPLVILGLVVFMPLLLSGVLGAALAKFDQLNSTRELPVYIAVRPMTNGGFVIAKLAMALATSVVSWLLAIAGALFCLAVIGNGTLLFSSAGLVTPFGPVPYLTGCLPVLLLLVTLTWKNLIAGIGAGLTGRLWLVNVSTFWRGLSGAGLIALVMAARLYENFKESLLHWLTAILIVCLAVKLTVSIAAFVLGLRRNAITIPAIGWIVGGWLVCSLFVAGYASHVCNSMIRPDLRLWLVLGAFLFLPLTDLAIAPLALAWNRHR